MGGAGQVARNPPRNVSKKGSTALLVIAYQVFCLWGDFTEKTPFLLGNAHFNWVFHNTYKLATAIVSPKYQPPTIHLLLWAQELDDNLNAWCLFV